MPKHASAAVRRAAVYGRMSTDKQEDSIDRQLASVLPYAAKNGYAVVGEPYLDEGIAGDVFDKRPGFQRLLRDAAAGLFDVILTDEWSRLSRQEPVDFIARVVKPLKDAGVTLDCVAEGPQRWDDLAQLILMTVRADKSQGESKTRSYRTLTGMAKAAAEGRILARAPYGYLTEYETVQEPGRPPRVRPLRFVPDPRRAHVVRWVFERYAAGGWAFQDLAHELNARAVECPPPAGKGGRATATRARGEPCARWTVNSVRALLNNPTYTGALVWNRRSRGKYHVLADGQAVAGAGDERRNDPGEWIVAGEPPHEALIPQELFEAAQERMRSHRGGIPKRGAYLFSGLVTCAHCGRRLCGITRKGKPYYRCHMYDDAGEVVCAYNAVSEDWLFDTVIRVLQEETLAPGRIEQLRAEARRQDEAERSPGTLDGLRKRLADVQARIDRGNETLLLLPPDRVQASIATLRGWEAERDGLQAELRRQQGDGGALAELDGAVEACEAMLWRLREARAEGEELLLRQVIREAVSRIELRWEKRPYGTKTRYVVTGGVIHLYPQLLCPALHAKPWRQTTSGPRPAST